MIFSLAVIVCEQQTLFAPHYTTYGGTSLVASDTTNSLVPIAGVNRLVALAGKTSSAIAIPPLVRPDVSNGLQTIPDPNMPLPAPTPVERPVLGPVDDGCPPCDFELRFGVSGSADPGGHHT